MARTATILTLGEGVFTASDIAKILYIPYYRVNYWFGNYIKKKFAEQLNHQYHFEIDGITAVNFYSLIEIHIFSLLREKGVKPNKIIEAHRTLARFYGTKFPFATKPVYSDGGTIFFGENSPMIVANRTLQMVITEFLEPYCEKISFNEDKLAEEYYPMGKDKSIVVNPNHQFGTPTITGTNIIPDVIYSLYLGGETIRSLTRLYPLSEQQVKDAIEYKQVV